MQRISSHLATIGHQVTWLSRSYEMHDDRVTHWFKSGFGFYLEYNLRLLVRLFAVSPHVVYAVDLDTMLAAKLYSVLRRLPLIYDSHEYFTEVPELADRPIKKAIWTALGKWAINSETQCITVNQSLADILGQKYKCQFEVVRNVPPHTANQMSQVAQHLGEPHRESSRKIIVYLGAVNQGRGIELYCRAAQQGYLDSYDLWIIGNGDLLPHLRAEFGELPNVKFHDWVKPDQLHSLLAQCWLGLNLLDAVSQSYYYSLTNKFFDYCHHGLPALHMDYPEYRKLQERYPTSYLLKTYDIPGLLAGITHYEDPTEYKKSKLACKEVSLDFNWEYEKVKLTRLSDSLVGRK